MCCVSPFYFISEPFFTETVDTQILKQYNLSIYPICPFLAFHVSFRMATNRSIHSQFNVGIFNGAPEVNDKKQWYQN